jgi:S1-C subfamily serine protease
VITSIDGRAVDAMTSVQARVRSKEPGDALDLGLLRGDEKLKVSLTLAGTRG